MIEDLQIFTLALGASVPLEAFASIASFLEEVIAPIPSPIIGALVGSSALAEGYSMLTALLLLGFLMALGKTVACTGIYWVMFHASKATATYLERCIGVSHEDIIAAGQYFKGTLRDHLLLIAARAIPFFPSSPISVLAGIIKAPLRFYLLATFIGTYVRSMFFIFIGFSGYETLLANETIPHLDVILFSVGCVLIFGYVWWLYVQSQDAKKFKVM